MKKLSLMQAGTTCLLAISFGLTVLNAQPAPETNPRLAIRSGLVEVARGNTWIPAQMGQSLFVGERLRTATGSSAVLELGPGKVITLNEVSTVMIGQWGSGSLTPIVHLQTGSMKVFSTSDIRVAAKDTVLESASQPLDLELGYQGDRLNLTVFSGAVQNGPMTIRGGNQDPNTRTYTVGARPGRRQDTIVTNPTFYVYPYFLYGFSQDPNAGRIVPPVVNNPTNPGYRPTQIVPPMSDPIRVPVTKP